MSDDRLAHTPDEELRRAAEARSRWFWGRGLHSRRRALRALDSVGPESLDTILELLRTEQSRRRRLRRIAVWAVCAYAVLIVMMLLLGHGGPVNIEANAAAVVAASFVVGKRIRRKAARRLTEFGDVRSIGYLAEALHERDTELRRLAMQRLTVLLPQVRASDVAVMTDEQRLALYKALTTWDPSSSQDVTRFSLAAFEALEQIGDERAVPYVTEIASRQPRSVDEQRVVAAAIGCLPALEERVRLNHEAARLLRPADAPAEGAGTLLRPTYGAGESDPALLLRASQPPEAEG